MTLSDLAALDAAALDRVARVQGRPGFVLSPRLPVVFDAGAAVWPLAAELARDSGALGLVLMPKGPAEAAVRTHLGADWQISHWDSYDAPAADLMPRALATVEAGLPPGWSVSDLAPDGEQDTRDVIALNHACGVSPNPPAAMKSLICPTHTVLIRDADGALKASATAQMMFPDTSPHAGKVFIGLISVDPAARGQGLGRHVTAHLLTRSQPALGWRTATAWVAPDNPASIATVTGAGFARSDGLFAMIAMPGGGRFTR